MSQQQLTITLIDFLPNFTTNCHSPPPSMQLFSWLKTKINTPKKIPFSIEHNTFLGLVQPLPPNYFAYEIKIVQSYSCIVVSGRYPNRLIILDIDTRLVRLSVELKEAERLINGFYIEENASCEDQDYIYITTNKLLKYNFRKLTQGLPSNECLIWKSTRVLPNSWQLAPFKSHLYVCDYSEGLLKFDKENGEFLSCCRSGRCMYGICFTQTETSTPEMFLTYAEYSDKRLEVLRLGENGDDEWTLNRRSEMGLFEEPYSIFYEECTRLIYVSDFKAGKIVVFDGKTLQVVTIMNENLRMIYAIQVDIRNGKMYVCSGNGLSLSMFQ